MNTVKYFIVSCLVFGFVNNVFAYNDFEIKEPCGSAKIISGEDCGNINVEFQFNNCLIKSGAQVSKEVTCQDSKLKAIYKKDNYIYDAEFSKAGEGWGKDSWKFSGKLVQWVKNGSNDSKKNPVKGSNDNVHESKAPKEIKALKEPKVAKEIKEAKDAKVANETKDSNESNASKENVKPKETKAIVAKEKSSEEKKHSESNKNVKSDKKEEVKKATVENKKEETQKPAEVTKKAQEHKSEKEVKKEVIKEVEPKPEDAAKKEVEHKSEEVVKKEDGHKSEEANKQTEVSKPAEAGSTSPYKFSSFFDFRYSNLTSANDPDAAHAESGFLLNDGAVFFNYEKEKVAIAIDLAFRRSVESDYKTIASSINPSPTLTNKSTNNNIAIGVDKSQLFIKYKLSELVVIDFGQFDTIFGVEVNDSKDRVFGKTGLIYDILPLTHTGVMMEWNKSGYAAKAFAANPNNNGSFGKSSTGDTNTEYGGTFGYADEKWRGQFGVMSRPILKPDASAFDNRLFLDVTFGGTFGNFSIDIENTILNDPSKNTLTPKDSADKESAGTGLFVLASYKMGEQSSYGIRLEKLTNDPLALGNLTTAAEGFCYHYKLSSEIDFTSEYLIYQFETVDQQKSNDSRFSIGTIVSF